MKDSLLVLLSFFLMPPSSTPPSLVGCSSTLTVGVSLLVPLPGLGELCRADGRNEERVANI